MVAPLEIGAARCYRAGRADGAKCDAPSHWPAIAPGADLVLNGATGEMESRKDFRDRHLIDRIVGTGIAAHEGQLFGAANQLLGLLTALGLILICTSGVVMWWRRRDPGVLGAPKAISLSRFSLGLFIPVIVLGVYLPLFGASLLVVLLIEKLLLSAFPVCVIGWGSRHQCEALSVGCLRCSDVCAGVSSPLWDVCR